MAGLVRMFVLSLDKLFEINNTMNEKLRTHAHNFSELLDRHSIFRLLKELVEIAEELSLPGGDKKEAVVDALRFVVNLLPDSPRKSDLQFLLENTIPDAIDLAIAVAKSKAFEGCWKRLVRWCKC